MQNRLVVKLQLVNLKLQDYSCEPHIFDQWKSRGAIFFGYF